MSNVMSWNLFFSYEIQLETRVRRKGLGKFLIQILQLIANRYTIIAVVTCLRIDTE